MLWPDEPTVAGLVPQQEHGVTFDISTINIDNNGFIPDGFMSSILAFSTNSLATAKRNTQEMDGAHSMHFFNRHLQRVQQQSHGGGGSGRHTAGHGVDASSSSIFSNATLSPASCTATTSIHSALTSVSESSTSSGTFDFSGITDTTSSSVYALSSSDPSEMSISRATTATSDMSTLCGRPSKTPLRPRGVRRFVRWTFLENTLSYTPATPEHQEKAAPGGGEGEEAEQIASHRLTLKQLSMQQTQRFFNNFQTPQPSTTTITTATNKRVQLPPRQNGKKGPKRPDAKAFSDERTFMHWIKFGMLLGSMALTLLSFGKSVGLQVGLFLVLVAMSMFVYATTVFHLRNRWMKQFRLDVVYYDRIGPSILFMALFVAFATNVALTVLKLMSEDGSDDGLNFYNGHHEGPLDI
ncbi:hypothetical protein BGX29_007552 [Mortierella sp. GBA35]|nr:hypothetical protein BGX29_007552 [Mortierella sp. GBA35]